MAVAPHGQNPTQNPPQGPYDFANRTFTVNRDILINSIPGFQNACQLRAGDTGYIINISPNRQGFEVRIPNRTKSRLRVPRGCGTVGGFHFTQQQLYQHRALLITNWETGTFKLRANEDYGSITALHPNGVDLNVALVSRKAPNDILRFASVPFFAVDVSESPHREDHNTRGRRCKLLSDHRVDRAHGGPISLRKDDAAFIMDFNPQDQTAKLQIPDSKKTPVVPIDVLEIAEHYDKRDFVNRTFRMRHDFRTTYKDSNNQNRRISLDAEPSTGPQVSVVPDIGTIRSVKGTESGSVIVSFHLVVVTQNNVVVEVPFSAVEVGWPVGSYDMTYVVPPTISPAAGELQIQGDPDTIRDIRPFFETFTELLIKNEKELPDLSTERRAMLDTKKGRQDASKMFRDGIYLASPELLEVLARKQFTLEDIIAVCKPAGKGNHKAGIYIRIYWKFPPGSPYHGKVYVYVGKASDFDERNHNHDVFAGNKKKRDRKNPHYKIAHTCGEKRVLQLFVHPKEAGGSMKRGDMIRDIMEQVLAVMLGAYSDYVLGSQASPTTDPNTVKESLSSVAEDMANAQTIMVHAEEAAVKTEFRVGRLQSTHGRVEGLCIASPLYEGDLTGEAMRWIRIDLGDRLAFTRKAKRAVEAYKTKGEGHVLVACKLNGTSYGKAHQLFFHIYSDGKNGLVPGTPIYTTIEIMKHGAADIPYFQNPDVGCFNNWQPNHNTANRILVRSKWLNPDTGEWMEKYDQVIGDMRKSFAAFNFRSSEHGSLTRYANAVALYASLMRAPWDNAPPFYPIFKPAKIITPVINHFTQCVELQLDITESAPNIDMMVEFDVQPAANYMHNVLKLKNVAGTWREFTNLEQRIKEDPVIGNVHKGKKTATDRTMCDQCQFARTVFGVRGEGDKDQCERFPGTQRCKSCVTWGRPCSWSYFSELFGKDWHLFSPLNSAASSGIHTQRAADIAKALFLQPYQADRCKPRKISNPRYLLTLDEIDDEDE